jgi:hypothetical protein
MFACVHTNGLRLKESPAAPDGALVAASVLEAVMALKKIEEGL